MSPSSLPVLGGAALVSAPAWAGSLAGGSLLDAMVRFLVCVVLVWAGLNLVAALVGPSPRQDRDQDATGAEPRQVDAAA